MASLPHLTMKDARTIRVVTKKLRLNSKSLVQLEQAQKAGIAPQQAIANLLGIEEGEDAKAFLAARLTEGELEVITRFLGEAKDGSFLKD
jgi:hypothetical protein